MKPSGGGGLPSGGKPVTTKPGQYPPKGKPQKPPPAAGGGKGHQPTHVPPSKSHPSGGVSPAPPKSGGTPPPKSGGTTTPPVAPFLTPVQQAALDNIDTKYSLATSADQRKVADATTAAGTDRENSAHTHAVQTDNANQVMAARGLFQSSIRDSDLNDLDASMTIRNNLINTNLNRLILDTNTDMGNLTSDWVYQHNLYNSLAAQNASAVTPSTTPTPTNSPPGGGSPPTPGKPSTKPNERPGDGTTVRMANGMYYTISYDGQGHIHFNPTAYKLQTGVGIVDPLAGGNGPGGKPPTPPGGKGSGAKGGGKGNYNATMASVASGRTAGMGVAG